MSIKDRFIDESIYDGCAIVPSELLKENFEGFKRDEVVVINHLKGTMFRTNLNDFREKE
jgi:hypothetical protein